MTAAISGTNPTSTLSTQSKAIDESLSQRVGLLLKRSGIEVEGNGPLELTLSTDNKLIISGDVTNKDALYDALSNDTKLKNLLKASSLAASQSSETNVVDSDAIAGVSKDQLAEIWRELKNKANGDKTLEKIVTKLQVLDAFGQKYTGEVSAEAILSSNSDKEYYKSLVSSMQYNTPSILGYLSDSSSSKSYSLVDYVNSSNNGNDLSNFLGMDSSAAVAKAYSRINSYNSANAQSISTINFDA